MEWYSLPVKEISSVAGTDFISGLSESEARKRAKEYGLNEIPRPRPFTRLQTLISQFQSPLILILVGAGFVTVYLRDFSDTAIIAATVAINVAFGYFQERKTSNILEALYRVVQAKALVKRDGGEKEISQEAIVPGDVVILKAGAKAPADGRLIYANDLKINESALTGEWLPVDKDTRPARPDSPVA
ncbi:MAG: cation-transporting P-type ATPase, partial [Candidatus Colwellbacteria bacterium]|nr:cation-transporting P-type ATPase [Candidatus Colwellbacteria bacterium]